MLRVTGWLSASAVLAPKQIIRRLDRITETRWQQKLRPAKSAEKKRGEVMSQLDKAHAEAVKQATMQALESMGSLPCILKSVPRDNGVQSSVFAFALDGFSHMMSVLFPTTERILEKRGHRDAA